MHHRFSSSVPRAAFAPWLSAASLVVILLSAVASAQQTNQPFAVAGSQGQWLIEQASRAGDARVAPYLGRDALWLKNNTHAIHSGSEFQDGTIEFDVAPMERGNFVAIVFRRGSFQQHENIYLRVHNSGDFDAVQYAPRINGSSTWQLYPEFTAQADLPRNQWTHVRVEVRGSRLEIYWNNGAQPLLSVARLRSQLGKGSVAFWARVNNESATWAAALANISIRPLAAPAAAASPVPPAPDAGLLTNWEIAEAVPMPPGPVLRLPASSALRGWRPFAVEESGLVNLTRALGSFKEPVAAFARTTLKSDSTRSVALDLGYSDQITVFLNGVPVYSGVNAWESRYPGFLGHVKLGSETVWLHLRPGENELILATRDDQRFGWGFVARLNELPQTTPNQ
jgi:hypothetical protein